MHTRASVEGWAEGGGGKGRECHCSYFCTYVHLTKDPNGGMFPMHLLFRFFVKPPWLCSEDESLLAWHELGAGLW